MKNENKIPVTRRDFIKKSAATIAGVAMAPYLGCGKIAVEQPMTRTFGKIGFDVTSFGLGGQASLQWTPEDVDPVPIILKAYERGVNYYDTSNVYGPSQMNFGKAFRELGLVPGLPGYSESRRAGIFLTSKTHLRHARGGDAARFNYTNGTSGTKTVDDVKRSLSQMFGDGEGDYPDGAYLNMVLIHNLTQRSEMEAVYLGYDDTDPQAEEIGALAALRDLRDGTNLTGLNPGEERLIRHVGFSGHFDPALMMEMIRRDHRNLLEAMLVAINANDKLFNNMQYNVIPVAAGKDMAVIAMKVFADGAMFTKPAHWTEGPHEVVRTVGSDDLPSRPLIEYSVSTPGIHTAIIGIGQISDQEEQCQLVQNISSAQVSPGGLSETDRETIERLAAPVKEGQTNYFQQPAQPLTAPAFFEATVRRGGDEAQVNVTWGTALAGNAPIERYEVLRNRQVISEMPYAPQTRLEPFAVSVPFESGEYAVRVSDTQGRTAVTDPVVV